ncbi:MAG: hypothetical protein CMP62_05980 [Flavobacteriales bacterium]|nr:hypothetical protein [Flavobacteriales bacterium]
MTVDLQKGFALINDNNIESAKKYFLDLLNIDNENSLIYSGIATCYELNNDLDKAIDYFNKAINYDKDNYLFFNQLGNIYKKKFNLKNNKTDLFLAKTNYEKTLLLNKNYLPCLNNYGTTLLEIGDYDKAIEIFLSSISIDPNNPLVLSNLGNCYTKKSLFSDALIYHKKSVELEVNNYALYYNLGHTLLWLKDFSGAEKNLLKSIELNKENYKAYSLLINLYYLSSNIDSAMIASKNALKLNNKYPATYVHLANCLVAVGKTQEAIDALEMSLKLDNTNFEAYYGLAQLKYSFSDFDLSYLKDALINDNISLESKAFSAMALWCYYDNIKEYEIGVNYLKISKSSFMQYMNIDPDNVIENEKLYFDKIQSSYNELSKINFLKKNKTNNFIPIFILGMPRSGTSLLEQMLSSHSKIHGLGEKGILQNIVEGIDYPSDISDFNVEHLTTLRNLYINRSKNLIPDNKTIITDKLPHNFLYIGLIKQLLPESKIIHIQRNKMDNCFSIYSKLFVGKMDWHFNWLSTLKYYDFYDNLMKFWNQSFSDEIYKIQYEDIIDNTEKNINNLLSFCDLDFEKKCLDFIKNKRPVFTASALAVRENINSESIGKWNNYKDHI